MQVSAPVGLAAPWPGCMTQGAWSCLGGMAHRGRWRNLRKPVGGTATVRSLKGDRADIRYLGSSRIDGSGMTNGSTDLSLVCSATVFLRLHTGCFPGDGPGG